MKKIIRASIVIPTKDKNNCLRLILQALLLQTEKRFEVILVMDGCSSNTIKEIERYKFSLNLKKILCKTNVGRAKARNIGLRNVSGRIVIFLDDDRIPEFDFVEKHILGHKTRCILIGERKNIFYTDKEIEYFYKSNMVSKDFHAIVSNLKNEKSEIIRHLFMLLFRNYLGWVGVVTGNISMEKEDLVRINCFDENFSGWGWEDAELGFRLCKEKIRIVKDGTILNYHFEHKHDVRRIAKEENDNYRYFSKKMGKHYFSRLILKLLHIRIRLEFTLSKTY